MGVIFSQNFSLNKGLKLFGNKVNVAVQKDMTQLAASRSNAGIDKDHEDNIKTRGVIKTTDTSPRNELDPVVLPNI